MNNKELSDDWKWQVANSLRYMEKGNDYEVKIPPYYEGLIDYNNQQCPIKKQCMPDIREINFMNYDQYNINIDDSLGEDNYSPAKNLVHKYKEKVLLIVTNQCFMNCRFCTRKRITNKFKFDYDLSEAFEYIKEHEEIRDVLISGGDPLTLDDSCLESIIKTLRKIKHIDIIRIGTRSPVVMPMRITDELVRMLKKYNPIWINTHFNTYAEVTEQSKEACIKIVEAGIPLGNQSVLLKDVNDNVEAYKKLCLELVKIRVRPYYLYQCDVGRGLEHFRTKIQVGMEIVNEMRKITTGFAVPEYVIDSPNGGKIHIQKNNIIKIDDEKIVFENYDGKRCVYPQGQ